MRGQQISSKMVNMPFKNMLLIQRQRVSQPFQNVSKNALAQKAYNCEPQIKCNETIPKINLRSQQMQYFSTNQKPLNSNFEDAYHEPLRSILKKYSSQDIMQMENTYSAHNYKPLKVVFEKAQGIHVWDPEGKHYYDCLGAYSAVNQGHCHPKIMQALIDQAHLVTLSGRAFFNSIFPQWSKYVTDYFGFETVLPMNTGAEAVETAVKAARKWGYEKKGIPENEAIIIGCTDSFHGRTMTAISLSDSHESRDGFGPFLPGIVHAEYNNVESLRKLLEQFGPYVAGFMFEPMQGEAGVVVPDDNYIRECYQLCKEHNVLFIADEVQTGIGRTGKNLCVEHFLDWDKGEKPDMVTLGKAISGGYYPVSCVLGDWHVMDVFTPGTHGSTTGGSPLAGAVSLAALQVIKDEHLDENAARLGQIFRERSQKFVGGIVNHVRGMGLLNAYVINQDKLKPNSTVYDICLRLKDNGLLAKQTRENVIRFAPPLIITEEQLNECLDIIEKTLKEFEK